MFRARGEVEKSAAYGAVAGGLIVGIMADVSKTELALFAVLAAAIVYSALWLILAVDDAHARRRHRDVDELALRRRAQHDGDLWRVT